MISWGWRRVLAPLRFNVRPKANKRWAHTDSQHEHVLAWPKQPSEDTQVRKWEWEWELASDDVFEQCSQKWPMRVQWILIKAIKI